VSFPKGKHLLYQLGVGLGKFTLGMNFVMSIIEAVDFEFE
jgi:hypothetical protein